MGEQIYSDVPGNTIVLADVVRESIVKKHPETAQFIEQIGTVLSEPDEIRVSLQDARHVLYYRFDENVFGGKWLVVVVKQIDNHFISTFFITDRVKSGDTLWTKK